MKTKRRLLSGILCLVLLMTNFINVFAQESIENGEQYMIDSTIPSINIGEISNTTLVPGLARGFYVPTTAHNWDDGNLTFDGQTSTGTHLYTNKYFTNFTEGHLYVKSYSSYDGYPRGDVTVTMYRKELLFDEVIFTETIEAGKELSLRIWNYKTDKDYYLKFTGTFNVSGYVSKTS